MQPPAAATTALMRQYLDVKARYPDAIVFFRLGDFYEMFHEDAVYAARVLDLTLTTRDKGKEDPVPMCGIPHHAVRPYLVKLTELGHRVALCEQLEDPRAVRGIVKRDVVRVVTPGVNLDEESLDPRAPSYVAAVAGDARGGYGLAFLDVTTGDFRATEAATGDALSEEIGRVAPRELVFGRDDDGKALADLVRAAHSVVPRTTVAGGNDGADLARVLGAAVATGLAERTPRAAAAAAAVLRYASATQPGVELPVTRLDVYGRTDTLVIDEQARRHLELTESLLDRRRVGSLIEVLDESRTAMGGRLLRRWLLFPSVDVAAIRRRHDAVERLVAAHGARDAARRVLSEVADIERLVARARLGVATPRDLAVLGRSLARLPLLRAALEDAEAGELGGSLAKGESLLSLGDDLAPEIAAELARVLRDDAPAVTKDGGFVNAGVSPELDELRDIAAGGRDRIAAIEARERERTGIPSLKVKFNSVFGYYIEVTRSHLASVPAEYRRKQTVANAERFVTPELGEFEQTVLSADERRITLELELFAALRTQVATASSRLLTLAARVATIDTLAALAEVAHRSGYCRPEIDDSGVIDLADARHPVVERLAAAGAFVPNDVRLDPAAEQILIVSGPNMAGKSTLIRQVALAVIQAQMGGFVAARRARIGHLRPCVHARRRGRQSRPRRIDVHGRDARDGAHPPLRDRAQRDRARRDRARYVDLRRCFDRVGGGRAPSRPRGREDAVRDPLPRARRAGGVACPRAQRVGGGARMEGRGRVPAQADRWQREPVVRGRGGEAGRAAACRGRTGRRHPAHARVGRRPGRGRRAAARGARRGGGERPARAVHRDGRRGRGSRTGAVGGGGAAQGGRPRRALAPRRARAHCRAGKEIDAKHLAWL